VSRIVHLSLKVEDIQKSGDFYQTMFNFQDAVTKKTRDHTSRHMTDGEIDFTLITYDKVKSISPSVMCRDHTSRHMTAGEID